MSAQKPNSSAGILSIVLALAPLGVILLCLLPILTRNTSGEAGLCAMVALGVITYYGTHAIAGTSILGLITAFVALHKTKRRKGWIGLVLNSILFLIALSLLISHYHHIYNDPDRLNLAIWRGEIKEVEKLLKRGFDTNHVRHDGNTALHDALGNKKMVELLIAHGVDINAKGRANKTPLHTICSYRVPNTKDATEIFDLLVEHGADIEARTSKDVGTWGGYTPLHCAAKADRVLLIQKLLELGANTEAETDDGKTPLCMAAEKGNIGVAKLLIQYGAKINKPTSKEHYPLIEAAHRGKKIMVDYLLTAGANPNVENSYGQTALLFQFLFARNPEPKEIIRLLLNAGADINKANDSGDTLLHHAALQHRTERIKYLLSNGADINASKKHGRTPLNVAVSRCQPKGLQEETVKLLLDNGARIDIADNRSNHKTPLERVRKWRVKNKEQRQYRNKIIALMKKYPPDNKEND